MSLDPGPASWHPQRLLHCSSLHLLQGDNQHDDDDCGDDDCTGAESCSKKLHFRWPTCWKMLKNVCYVMNLKLAPVLNALVVWTCVPRLPPAASYLHRGARWLFFISPSFCISLCILFVFIFVFFLFKVLLLSFFHFHFHFFFYFI